MKLNLATLFFLFCATLVSAQTLPVRSITIFKNGRSMIERTGKVKATNSIYSARELPNALFGTYWVSTPADALKSVFTKLDSVAVMDNNISYNHYYKSMSGKTAKIYLSQGPNLPLQEIEGRFENVITHNDNYLPFISFQTKAGTWLSFRGDEIRRVEFLENPKLDFATHIEMKKRLDVTFNNAKTEQDMSIAYLTNNLGWTPVYRLELGTKNKGKLSLRAEIVNDAEHYGTVADLKLAVGIPNFAFADKASNLVNFDPNTILEGYRNQGGNGYQNTLMNNYQVAFDPETYEERVIEVPGNANPDGSQVEDYYFYNLKKIELPKASRYQFPIFETEIEPKHFFECNLPDGGPNGFQQYNNNRNKADEKRNPVIHFIEFKNNTDYPWTTGVANLLSGADLQPISQDKIPFTAPGATSKVRITETPEVKVTQTEGDVKREEDVSKFFNHNYDRVTIEGQVCVINYKKETITLKIKRKIEGKPTQSPDEKWTLKQEEATLRINSEYNIEWEITLKPGEERKWKYQYEVFMDF